MTQPSQRSRDYEYLGHLSSVQYSPHILEAYAGADIVQWWGNILHQLGDMKTRAEETGNDEYVSLLARFIRTWNENELTGSVNAEDVKSLKTASEWAGALPWNFSNYFQALSNWLRRLQASIEQLPMTSSPPADSGGGGGGMPAGNSSLDAEKDPAAPQFGPEDEQGDMEAPVEDKLEGGENAADDIAAELENDLETAVGANRQ